MPSYFNAVGSSLVTGTQYLDRFFAFTFSENFDAYRPDAVLANFSWTTNMRRADGTYLVLTGSNVQISQDVFSTGGAVDVLYGSNRSDAIVYNNGAFADGLGSTGNVQQFDLAGGDDFADFSAHGVGGTDFSKQITVRGGFGNDTIIGGSNNDQLFGDDGNDLLVGNAGGDTIDGGEGDDTIYGDDLGLYAVGGQDVLRGRGGNDTMYGGAKGDVLEGGDGNDVLRGELSGDTLRGGNGDDILYGDEFGAAAGGDKLYGDAGNDWLFGGGGDDALVGGTETDTAVFTGNRSDYSVILQADGSWQITDLRAGSPDGSDNVWQVEFFQFADGTFDATALNNPPTITSDGGGDTATIFVQENSTFVTTVTATDPDAGSVFRYSIAGGVDGALFTIDPVTGALSFLTGPDFENPTDADGDGDYSVVVRVTDGAGGVDLQTLSVMATDAPDGASPIISSDGGGNAATVTVDENTTAVTTVVATDADGTSPTYRISGGADAALFVIDAATGVVTFANAPDHEAPADANGDNVYQVTVEATDGVNTDRQFLSVVVGNINDNSPVITSGGGSASLSVALPENSTAVTTVVASDADGTAPTYVIAGGADAGLFTIDAATGVLSFIQAPDYEMPGDAGGDNIYEVIVEANDGANSDQQAITVTIGNLNDSAPIITSNGGGPGATLSVAENGTAVTTIVATDPDGATAFAYRVAGGADAALFQVDANGVVTFRTAPDFEDPLDAGANNVYDVIVEASDGVNATTQAMTINVTDVNEVGRTITGTSAMDRISPTASSAALRSTALNDTIYALGGNDIIDGGGGADRMEGGSGNDTYTIDTFVDDGRSSNDDLVIEIAGCGTDLVNASVSYRLADEVENLTLIGAAVFGYGNALDNQILGNALSNQLYGLDGVDTILGNDGDDVIDGGNGNDVLVGGNGADNILGGDGADRLDGGTGADRMEGGLGNDTYIVDTFSDDGNAANDDFLIEAAGGGVDAVNASVSYVLASEIENLTLSGTVAINGTGNTLANVITGNSAANVLIGLDGNDTLNGGGGDDVLDGGNDSDTLDGGAGNDQLFGGAASDTLRGSAGSDLIVGGTGKDTLTGGTEADVFRFAFGDTTLNTNLDRITDFVTGVDRIDIDFITGAPAAGAYLETTIATNTYADALAAANAVRVAGTTFVFVGGSTDGWLFWDATGDGLFEQSIQLNGLNLPDEFSPTDLF